MIGPAAILGVLLTGAGVTAYWAYTLLGVTVLAPLLKRVRQIAMLTGGALGAVAGIGGVASGDLWTIAPASIALVLLGYSLRNQWLLPTQAAGAVAGPRPAELDDDDVVAILPDGRALPLRWARRRRTVRCGQAVVVHCSLARSVAAFDAPAAGLAAVLPHPTGFQVAASGRTWDGVDGTALDGGAPLTPMALGLSTVSAWEREFPGGELWLPASGPLPAERTVTPLVPGARGVTDAMAWGRVEDGCWTAQELDVEPEIRGRYLARWAAVRRGIRLG